MKKKKDDKLELSKAGFWYWTFVVLVIGVILGFVIDDMFNQKDENKEDSSKMENCEKLKNKLFDSWYECIEDYVSCETELAICEAEK